MGALQTERNAASEGRMVVLVCTAQHTRWASPAPHPDPSIQAPTRRSPACAVTSDPACVPVMHPSSSNRISTHSRVVQLQRAQVGHRVARRAVCAQALQAGQRGGAQQLHQRLRLRHRQRQRAAGGAGDGDGGLGVGGEARTGTRFRRYGEKGLFESTRAIYSKVRAALHAHGREAACLGCDVCSGACGCCSRGVLLGVNCEGCPPAWLPRR